MIECCSVPRANLTVLRDALQRLADFDCRYRSYQRTLDDVLNDWRNQANDVPIRMRRELLTDLAAHAVRLGHCPLEDREWDRGHVIYYASYHYPSCP